MSPRGIKKNERMRAVAKMKITKAALEVFAEYGFHGATMQHIMQCSGLSKGLVYHYFPSKEKIFFHLVDSALEISRNTWNDALHTPGTAWEKIEKLSENLVKVAFTDESSLYFLIMVQAITQGKGIPGIMGYILERSTHFAGLLPLVIEAQKSGQVVQGDPDVLVSTYIALFQGYTLLALNDKDLKNKITPDIFINVLRS